MSESEIPKLTLRLRRVLYLGVFIAPLLPYWGLRLASSPELYNLWAWFGIFVALGALPAIDHIIGKDDANPTESQIEELQNNHYYKWLVILIIPAQLFLLLYGAYAFSSIGRFNLWGQIGWIFSNGMCSATLAINAAHELIHKPSRTEQIVGSFLLATVCNTGFKIDHIRGHHVNLATPKDAYSASLNQSFYNYLLKTGHHIIFYPWKLEKRRLNRAGHCTFSWRNELFYGWAASAILLIIFYAFFGLKGLIFFLAQSAVAWFILQGINYIQHYGLIRRNLGPEAYEHPAPAHAWNSNYWLTNIILLHLPRHPDHHVHPRRSFQALQHIEESPQMPSGYAAMFLLALMPPLWFKVMNPRVLAYQGAGLAEVKKFEGSLC